jgi:hypothetical protein
LLRRLGLIAFIWLVVTGADFRCSFNSDPDDDRPVRPPDGNRAPVASDAAYSVPDNQELRGSMPAVDPDGDVLTWRIESGPSLGGIRDLDSRRGTFTYVPGATGADSFSFRASDGRLESNAANVLIAVQPAAMLLGEPIVRLEGGSGPDEVRAETRSGEWLLLDLGNGTRGPAGSRVSGVKEPLPPGALMSAADPAGAGRVALFGPTPSISWSDDGGASWRRARLPAGLRPVAVSWAEDGSLAGAAQGPEGVRVIVSRDQGRTWEKGPGWPGIAGNAMSAVPDPRGGTAVFLTSREGTTVWMARIRGPMR